MEDQHRPHLQKSQPKAILSAAAQEIQSEETSLNPVLQPSSKASSHHPSQSDTAVQTPTPGINFNVSSIKHQKSPAVPFPHSNHFTTNELSQGQSKSFLTRPTQLTMSSNFCPQGGATGHCPPKPPASKTASSPLQYDTKWTLNNPNEQSQATTPWTLCIYVMMYVFALCCVLYFLLSVYCILNCMEQAVIICTEHEFHQPGCVVIKDSNLIFHVFKLKSVCIRITDQ